MNAQGDGGQNYDFEIYEMEKVNNEENVNNLINQFNRDNGKGDSTEKDIEELERELAQLKNDIKNQELSIAELDEIQNKVN